MKSNDNNISQRKLFLWITTTLLAFLIVKDDAIIVFICNDSYIGFDDYVLACVIFTVTFDTI